MKVKIGIELPILNSSLITTVSVEDLDNIPYPRKNILLSSAGYAYFKHGKSNTLFLHRLITKCPRHLVVHHKDNNPLNNTRDNLEICTHGHNLAQQKKRIGTASKYKGVYFDKRYNKWQAKIQFNNLNINGGSFSTEEEAAKKAKELYTMYKGNSDQN